ncbi:hypothetical protein M413DRAFT_422079 [Hebeloma cylindrosporum]|uniref:Uncharacterized protein n=1 Tax=Hebeloma cylindrosporum TaxID=76867 RepID=A0A0C3CD75_HEBCY|nr:hypothetical protein M413DRAFT_422079 [Hebeloma cylindrosporum h7]
MPLFGSKNEDEKDTPGVGDRASDDVQTSHPVAISTGPGIGVQHPKYPKREFTGTMTSQTDHDETGNDAYGSGMDEQNNYFGHAFVEDSPYAPGGIGCTKSVGGPRCRIPNPPTGARRHSTASQSTVPQSSGGSVGQRLTGKFQSALGSLVGSDSLKAKGLQKEQEANSAKQKRQDLAEAEAERLEDEALMGRERAVGHGAHPVESSLGTK